ncbi:MAG: SpaA isopeptide-forming pilin-related protein [Clostridia bacterium]|nr:SpaA isopeptide-forming pilin-related protein [Clostridia bacterium]
MSKILVKSVLLLPLLLLVVCFSWRSVAAADIDIKTVGQEADVTFEILDENGNQITTVATSSNAARVEDLEPGTYTVKLLETPDSVIMSDTEYKVVLSRRGSVIRKTIFLKEKITGDYLSFRQGNEEPWGSVTLYDNSMGYQGCGPTSISIALTKMGMLIPGYDGAELHGYVAGEDNTMQPSEVGKCMIDNGYYVAGQGMSWEFPTFIFHKTLGLEEEVIEPGNAQRVLELLKEGWVGVASASAGYFTYGGHIIAVVENDGDNIVIIDPANGNRDGSYSVAQMNSQEAMPQNSAAKGTYANIKRWWLYNPYK